jgi:hypothetical protein
VTNSLSVAPDVDDPLSPSSSFSNVARYALHARQGPCKGPSRPHLFAALPSLPSFTSHLDLTVSCSRSRPVDFNVALAFSFIIFDAVLSFFLGLGVGTSLVIAAGKSFPPPPVSQGASGLGDKYPEADVFPFRLISPVHCSAEYHVPHPGQDLCRQQHLGRRWHRWSVQPTSEKGLSIAIRADRLLRVGSLVLLNFLGAFEAGGCTFLARTGPR